MNGKWITVTGKSKEVNFYFRARKNFSIGKIPQQLQLHIAAESHYVLWINGHILGKGPARGNKALNYFDTYALEQYIHPGENWVAVLVQSMNVPNFCSSPAAAAVLIDIEGIASTGKDWEVLHNDEWRQNVELYTKQTGFCEYRDLSRTSPEWAIGIDKETWQTPEIAGEGEIAFGKKLLPRPVPELRITSYVPERIVRSTVTISNQDVPEIEIARSIDETIHTDVNGPLANICTPLLSAGEHSIKINPSENADGISLTFDFGREIIGFFELNLTAPEGVIVDICHDEALFEGRVVARRCRYNFADRYITRNGKQTVGNSIHERGGRYIEISLRNFKSPVVLHSVKAVDRRYPFVQRGSFNCSDSMLNRIWDVCLETVSACTTDVFTDCPWRERAFWINDMMVGGIVSMQGFGDYRLNAHALRFAFSNRRDDGWLPSMSPDAGNSRNILLSTNLLIIFMLKDYYLYSGDRELLNEMLPEILKNLDVFESLMDIDHQIKPPMEMWNFFDWSYAANKISHEGCISSLLGWMYCGAVNTAIELLEQGGLAGRIPELKNKARLSAEGIEKRFWRDDKKMYSEFDESSELPAVYSQLAHALALSSGELPQTRKSAAVSALNSPSALKPEMYMFHFVFNQMREYGLFKEALENIRKYWGNMIKNNASTIWEYGVYDNRFTKCRNKDNAASLCHAFCSTPVNYFQTAILGVRPLQAGFSLFEATPVPHDLDFAEGDVPTHAGNIKIKWHKEDNRLKIYLFIPSGLKAKTAIGILGAGEHEFEIPADKK